ncbi:MAG: hypothetical protein JW819_12790 [Candidatus Krumholzibacteriota bacterium]|nr:hypothetical protein [Candidatus Krumholzibacteriota bacterium]
MRRRTRPPDARAATLALALLAAVLLAPAPAGGAVRLRASAFGSAGQPASSPNAVINSTLGQPTPIGVGAAGGVVLHAGFWYAHRFTGLTDAPPAGAPAFRLWQNYPNPFNPATTIRFTLAEAGLVRLSVLDPRGRLVRRLVDGPWPPGTHTVVWDGTDDAGRPVASGLYLYRLEAGGRRAVRRSLVLK